MNELTVDGQLFIFHLFIPSLLASPKMLTLGIVQTSLASALAQSHLSFFLSQRSAKTSVFLPVFFFFQKTFKKVAERFGR
jgi:hypothetical protein